MSNDPKLEVYQVVLRPNKKVDKTFRDFFIETLSEDNSLKDENDSFLFLEFFRYFITQVDIEEFILDDKSKKGFTAYDTKPAPGFEASITPHSTDFIIEGTIEGGPFGHKRNKSSIDNKAEKDVMDNKVIILDKFYFSLYTPFKSNFGVLFIQSYTSDSISEIFIDFIQGLFYKSGMYKEAKIIKFVPKKIIDDFKESSVVKKFTYIDRILLKEKSNTPIQATEGEFVIKITIESKTGLPKEDIGSWNTSINDIPFGDKKLQDFPNRKVSIQDTSHNKSCQFDIDSNFDIKPVIYLTEDKIHVEDGVPDFKELKEYCLDLLKNEIIPEIYLSHEVIEH